MRGPGRLVGVSLLMMTVIWWLSYRRGWEMRKTVGAVLLALALSVPGFSEDVPPCGYIYAPTACFGTTAGAVTVITRDVRREFVTAGAFVEAPVRGFRLGVNVDMFGVQDGEAAELGHQHAFRVLKFASNLTKDVGTFSLSARAGLTYSIEGREGAPLDPRMLDVLIEAAYRFEGGRGHLALSGGHDGAVGEWAVRADFELPISGRPSIVGHYELPLYRDRVTGTLPYVITAGGSVKVFSKRIK